MIVSILCKIIIDRSFIMSIFSIWFLIVYLIVIIIFCYLLSNSAVSFFSGSSVSLSIPYIFLCYSGLVFYSHLGNLCLVIFYLVFLVLCVMFFSMCCPFLSLCYRTCDYIRCVWLTVHYMYYVLFIYSIGYGLCSYVCDLLCLVIFF